MLDLGGQSADWMSFLTRIRAHHLALSPLGSDGELPVVRRVDRRGCSVSMMGPQVSAGVAAIVVDVREVTRALEEAAWLPTIGAHQVRHHQGREHVSGETTNS